MKRVAVCEKQILKTDIFKHEIKNRRKWNWKLNLQTAKTNAYYVSYKKEEEILCKWEWQIKSFVFIIWFYLLDCQLFDTSYCGVLPTWYFDMFLIIMNLRSWPAQPPSVYLTLLWKCRYLCVADRPHSTPYHSVIIGGSAFEFLAAFVKTRVRRVEIFRSLILFGRIRGERFHFRILGEGKCMQFVTQFS